MREGGATADNLADSNKQQCSIHSLLRCATVPVVSTYIKEETKIITQGINVTLINIMDYNRKINIMWCNLKVLIIIADND